MRRLAVTVMWGGRCAASPLSALDAAILRKILESLDDAQELVVDPEEVNCARERRRTCVVRYRLCEPTVIAAFVGTRAHVIEFRDGTQYRLTRDCHEHTYIAISTVEDGVVGRIEYGNDDVDALSATERPLADGGRFDLYKFTERLDTITDTVSRAADPQCRLWTPLHAKRHLMLALWKEAGIKFRP